MATNGGDLDRFTVKEILTQFVLPELEKKADADDLKSLERDVREMQRRVLTPNSVATMIGEALEKKEARGWTSKERAIAILLLIFAAIGAVLAVVQMVVILNGSS